MSGNTNLHKFGRDRLLGAASAKKDLGYLGRGLQMKNKQIKPS